MCTDIDQKIQTKKLDASTNGKNTEANTPSCLRDKEISDEEKTQKDTQDLESNQQNAKIQDAIDFQLKRHESLETFGLNYLQN